MELSNETFSRRNYDRLDDKLDYSLTAETQAKWRMKKEIRETLLLVTISIETFRLINAQRIVQKISPFSSIRLVRTEKHFQHREREIATQLGSSKRVPFRLVELLFGTLHGRNIDRQRVFPQLYIRRCIEARSGQ